MEVLEETKQMKQRGEYGVTTLQKEARELGYANQWAKNMAVVYIAKGNGCEKPISRFEIFDFDGRMKSMQTILDEHCAAWLGGVEIYDTLCDLQGNEIYKSEDMTETKKKIRTHINCVENRIANTVNDIENVERDAARNGYDCSKQVSFKKSEIAEMREQINRVTELLNNL